MKDKAPRGLTRPRGVARNPGMSAKRPPNTPPRAGKGKVPSAKSAGKAASAKKRVAARAAVAKADGGGRGTKAVAKIKAKAKARAKVRAVAVNTPLAKTPQRVAKSAAVRPKSKPRPRLRAVGGPRRLSGKAARGGTGVALARFAVGDVVRHKFYPFRGVIFDIDPVFANTEEWWLSIPEQMRPKKNQPFYHLLAENAETEYIAYVSEQNLLPDTTGVPVRHPQVAEYFIEDDEGRYRPVFMSMLN